MYQLQVCNDLNPRKNFLSMLCCSVELNENTREHHGLLYCFSCYTKLEIPVCASCHQVIENRIVDALGKKWHPEVRKSNDFHWINFSPFLFSIFVAHVVDENSMEINTTNMMVWLIVKQIINICLVQTVLFVKRLSMTEASETIVFFVNV